MKKTGRFIQIALAAADFAMKMSALQIGPEIAEWRARILRAASAGSTSSSANTEKLLQGGPGRISPFFIPGTIVNLASGHVSIRYGARGPNSATATACSASAHMRLAIHSKLFSAAMRRL